MKKSVKKFGELWKVSEALEHLRSGKMVILVDNEDRENEGDLVLPAQFATPENINFMVTHARGLVCLAMEAEMIDRLKLPQMTVDNEAPYQTAFTVSIEAREGVTTGISAHDRAITIQTAIRDQATRHDLVVPGHIFPLRAQPGGVLVRSGHTEGSVDLAKLAGFKSAAVICEILKEDGTMARLDDLKAFAEKFSIPMLSIADLIVYRLHNDSSLIDCVATSQMPTRYHQNFTVAVYQVNDRLGLESGVGTSREHLALILGDPKTFVDKDVLVRVHSECLTGDVLGSLRCDCGNQLDAALDQIARAGEGVLVYLRQEGRGIGLFNKIKAYALQDEGMDTVEANRALGFPPDLRKFGIGAQILRHIGVRRMKIMSNNPKKLAGLEGFGLEVTERVPLEIPSNPKNQHYKKTKIEKMGHLMTEQV